MHFSQDQIYLLGRGPDFYARTFGSIPESARVINVAAGPGYWPRANLNIDPIYSWAPRTIFNVAAYDRWHLFEKCPKGERALAKIVLTARAKAARLWYRDIHKHPTKYQPGALPKITNVTGDLVIVANYLFTYNLGPKAHIDAIVNLIQIAPEARIFPFSLSLAKILAEAIPQFQFDTNNLYLKITV